MQTDFKDLSTYGRYIKSAASECAEMDKTIPIWMPGFFFRDETKSRPGAIYFQLFQAAKDPEQGLTIDEVMARDGEQKKWEKSDVRMRRLNVTENIGWWEQDEEVIAGIWQMFSSHFSPFVKQTSIEMTGLSNIYTAMKQTPVPRPSSRILAYLMSATSRPETKVAVELQIHSRNFKNEGKRE